MKRDEVELLVREFIAANPQYTKNSFSITSEKQIQVMPDIVRLEDLKDISNVPADAEWLADIDEPGTIRVLFNSKVFEKMYSAMLDYHFGNLNFIEMLNKWSELLGIKEPPLGIRPPKTIGEENRPKEES